VFATQFHPEKSATAGLAMLTNFVRIASASSVVGAVG
jgi:imidazoleglycerol phosphate synthase glutamine amidotransferase subunit HisH